METGRVEAGCDEAGRGCLAGAVFAAAVILPEDFKNEDLNMAKDAGVDLVMVSPSANPPVCRIVDYGKFKYEQLRREKEAKKKQKTVEVKEVRLSPNIDVNDLNTKCNSARKFIEKGNKVKVSLRFRGREMAHIDSTKHILEDFAEKLSDIAVIEKAPKMEGRSMMMFLTEKR